MIAAAPFLKVEVVKEVEVFEAIQAASSNSRSEEGGGGTGDSRERYRGKAHR